MKNCRICANTLKSMGSERCTLQSNNECAEQIFTFSTHYVKSNESTPASLFATLNSRYELSTGKQANIPYSCFYQSVYLTWNKRKWHIHWFTKVEFSSVVEVTL